MNLIQNKIPVEDSDFYAVLDSYCNYNTGLSNTVHLDKDDLWYINDEELALKHELDTLGRKITNDDTLQLSSMLGYLSSHYY